MFTSVGASATLLIVGLVVFIALCFAGWHTALAALLSSFIVALGCADGWISAMFTTFPAGVGTFVTNNVLTFGSAGVFTFVMRETKCGEAMAKKIVGWIGEKNAPFAIVIISALLQLAGIQTYLFIVAPLTFALIKAADLPVHVGYASAMAAPCIMGFTLPGVTSMPNILPTTFLGTNLYAAPVMSLVVAAVGIVFMVWYIQHIVAKARKNGEHYVEPGEGKSAAVSVDMSGGKYGQFDPPSFAKSIIPVFVVLIAAAVFQLGLGLSAKPAVCFALWVTIAVVVFMNWDVCHKKITVRTILCKGFMELIPFMMTAACVYGFGTVTQASACFEPLKELIMSINVNPYLSAWLTIALMAGLCADGIGGLILWLGTFGQTYAEMPGVNVEALHRILVSTATTFDSLPHASTVASGMAVFKTSYKESYKHSFMLTVVNPVIFSLVAVAIAIIFY